MTLIQNQSLLGNQTEHYSSKTDFSHRSPATHPRLPGGQIPGPGCSLTTGPSQTVISFHIKTCMWAALLPRSVLQTALSTVAGDITINHTPTRHRATTNLMYFSGGGVCIALHIKTEEQEGVKKWMGSDSAADGKTVQMNPERGVKRST